MPVYRFYFLNESDRIHDFVAEKHSNDGATVRAAEALRHKHPWIEYGVERRRCMDGLPPSPASRPSRRHSNLAAVAPQFGPMFYGFFNPNKIRARQCR
jgi:hypothetical protein